MWAACWSSDVFVVAMTIATIVRRRIGNVDEGWWWWGGGLEVMVGVFMVHYSPKTLTEEVQRQRGQEGKKQACMCANEREREREGGEESQEVVVMSFHSPLLSHEEDGD